MKKIISLILCAILCLNLVCFSVMAEENYNLKDEQLTLLTAINIYNKDVQFSETITRGQFAEMLVKSIFDEPQYLISGTERFNDVDENHDYYDSIMLLKNLKVTYGDGEGNFDPEEEILTNDAIVMAVRFLGYTKLAEKTGYIPFAAQKGISEDIKYSYNDALTRYNAYLLIYNVLTVDVSDRYVDDTASFMRNYRTLHKIEGVVEDDGFINKYGLSDIPSNKIVIDGVIYKNGTNEKNLFGSSVIAFYKYDKNEEATILALIQTRDNETLTIKSKNIEKYIPKTHSYEYRESELEDKTVIIDIPKDITIIYNGVPLLIDDDSFTNENFVPENGTVTFFDSNGDKKYDYLYINSYETYVVNAVDTTQNIIYLKDFEKPLELKKEKFHIIGSEGEEIDLSKVKAGNTLSVMKSLSGEIFNIYVSNMTISDVVIAKDEDGIITTQNNGSLKLPENFIAKEYEKSDKKYNKVTEALESIEFSLIYKLYIDVFGEVAYLEPENTNLWTTATIIRAANNSRSKLKDNYVVELYGFDGNVSTFNLAEKVTVNDETNYTDRYEDEEAVEILNSFAGNQTNANRVFRYKLNLQGLITDVELPLVAGFDGLEDINSDRLFMLYDATANTVQFNTSGGFVGRFVSTDNCKVLLMDGSDIENHEKYAILDITSSFANKENANIIAYGTDTKNMMSEHLIKITSNKLSYPANSSAFFAVTNIIEEFDREEMVTRYRIDGFNGTTETSIYAESTSVINNIPLYNTGKTVSVSEGDIIVYSLDSTRQGRKTVNEITVLYDADGVLADGKGFFDASKGIIAGATHDYLKLDNEKYGNPLALKETTATGVLTPVKDNFVNTMVDPYRIAMGFIYSEKDGNVVLTTQPLNKQKYKNSLNYSNGGSEYVTEAYSNVEKKIIKIKRLDNGKVKVTAGTTADLKPYTVYGHDCAQVVFLGYWGLSYIYVLE